MTEEIKDKIKKAHYLKLLGNIPEGFVMVHEQVIEDLKDFDNWKDFKYNSNYIEEKIIEKVSEMQSMNYSIYDVTHTHAIV